MTDNGRREEVLDFEDGLAEGAGGAELEIDEGKELDVDPVKLAPDPGKPTERQIEERRRSHFRFRSWCRWCVCVRPRPWAPTQERMETWVDRSHRGDLLFLPDEWRRQASR